MKNLKKAPLVLVFALALLLTACGDTVTRENYEKIETGMSQDEVIALLGEPQEFNSVELGELSGGTARWTGKTQSISVTFTNDKVAFKRIGESAESTQ